MYEFQENLPVCVRNEDLHSFLLLMGEVKNQLRPTISVGSVDVVGKTVTFNNLIGEGVTPGGARFSIRPKGVSGGSWTCRVSRFFKSDTRFYISRTPDGGKPTLPHLPSADALAIQFASELEVAFTKSGPIVAHTLGSRSLRVLKGKLNVSKWVIEEPFRSTSFPVLSSEVEYQNLYNQIFSYAIQAILPKVTSAVAVNALRKSSKLVAVHQSARSVSVPVGQLPRLPVQWSHYEGAWQIAEVILRQKAGETRPDANFGVSFLVEPWRLLENALERLMKLVAEMDGSAVPQSQVRLPFLSWENDESSQERTVIPDGLLTLGLSLIHI